MPQMPQMPQMPNIKNIDLVIKAIEAQEIAQFSMTVWLEKVNYREHPSETCACIGGFIELLAGSKANMAASTRRQIGWASPSDACGFLGIPAEVGQKLFFGLTSLKEESTGDFYPIGLNNITAEMATHALTDLKSGKFKSWNNYRYLLEEEEE